MKDRVIEMLKSGKKNSDIVNELGVHRNTVSNIRKEFDGEEVKIKPIKNVKIVKPVGQDTIENSFVKIMKEKYDSVVYTLDTLPKIEKFGSGSVELDRALGGGYAFGRVVELFGNESSGKTTIALHAIKEIEKLGKKAMLVDMENAIDNEYVRALGINNLDIIVPTHGEEAVDKIRDAINSKYYSLIVVDSVATMLPLAELEGDTGDRHMGLHARMMSQAMRMINPIAAHNGCAVMFINQVRINIGQLHGNPEVTTGGKALDFYSTQRLRVSRKTTQGGQIKEDGENIGTPTYVEVVKNKIGKPFSKAEFNIMYGEGIDIAGELGNLLIKAGHITGRFKINEEKIANNANELRKYIKDNYDELLEIYKNSEQ